MNSQFPQTQLETPRRQFLLNLSSSLGLIALSQVLGEDAPSSKGVSPPLPHLPAKAKNCIFLMMEGGPSHIDTFDPKPLLKKLHLKEFNRQGERKSAMESGKRYFVQSPFSFIQAGQSGADLVEDWVHLKSVADHLCFYRGCQVDSVNHPTALYQMNTGSRFVGDPSLGAWINYGLGSPNQNVPGFVVLPEVSYPQGGPANWGNGFLPAHYQGTPLRPNGSPILNLLPPQGITSDHQRENLNLLSALNQSHSERFPWHADLQSRIAQYELAFRMQSTVPDILDLGKEPLTIQESYGLKSDSTHSFGRKCLLARKLVESGVRFVQVYAGTWDSHDYIHRAHSNLIHQVDQPIAALIQDLHQRGLLDETLVVWGGEFGRSPDNGVRGGVAYGRDHNPNAMTLWLAGGGVKAGHTIGATDDLGAEAVECKRHVRDFHVTLLHLLGLDDNRLTYFHGGRYKQLSQFGGKVITELLG